MQKQTRPAFLSGMATLAFTAAAAQAAITSVSVEPRAPGEYVPGEYVPGWTSDQESKSVGPGAVRR